MTIISGTPHSDQKCGTMQEVKSQRPYERGGPVGAPTSKVEDRNDTFSIVI